MNSLYTPAEENRLAAAALAEARHLRALAPAALWSAVARWACRATERLTHGVVHCVQADAATRPQAK
jgi:hypothetical protein